jgi:hypothetical protein
LQIRERHVRKNSSQSAASVPSSARSAVRERHVEVGGLAGLDRELDAARREAITREQETVVAGASAGETGVGRGPRLSSSLE